MSSKFSHSILLTALVAVSVACDYTRPNPGNGQTVYLESLGPDATSAGARGGPRDTVSYWDGGAGQGPSSITIDLSEQKASFYKGGTLVGVSQISSGREGYNTPTGSFKIMQKNPDHRSNLYGSWVTYDGTVINDDVDMRRTPNPPAGARYEGASMPNFMRITSGGVGMHAGYLPGFPASHGCIRMPEWMSNHFFRNVSIGTPVKVVH